MIEGPLSEKAVLELVSELGNINGSCAMLVLGPGETMRAEEWVAMAPRMQDLITDGEYRTFRGMRAIFIGRLEWMVRELRKAQGET